MRLTLADGVFWLCVLALFGAAWWRWKHLRADIAYAGYLALITAGFFWRVLFGGAFLPEGGGDISAILYPVYHFAQENLRQGVVPLWNPHLYAGIPFVGHIQSGVFYPPNLLMFLLTPEVTYRSLEYLLIGHVWLAGVLMYVLLRGVGPATDNGEPGTGNGERGTGNGERAAGNGEQGSGNAEGERGQGQVVSLRRDTLPAVARPAALLGAVVFMFNDFNITHFGNPNMVAVGAWLPLALLLYQRAITRQQVFTAILGGAVTGMAYLAGHIQPFLYILFAIGLYGVYATVAALRRESARAPLDLRTAGRAARYPAAYLALFLLFTIGVAAISLVPNLEMSAQSLRETLGYKDASQFSLPPAKLIGLFVPALFGRGPDIHWGPWERVEVGYAGILPLILAALGAIWRKDTVPRFFVLLAVLSLVLALGFFNVVHGWLSLVPGYSQIRVPARFVFLMDFAIAALAAYGFDALLRPLGRARRSAWRKTTPVLAAALGAVLLVFVPLMFVATAEAQSQDISIFHRIANGFNGLMLFALLLGGSVALLLARRGRWLSKGVWAAAVVLFVFLDLASLGAYLDTGEKDPTANFTHPDVFAFLRADRTEYRIETPEASWSEFQPNLGLIARLDDAAGIYNPLLLLRYARYWEAASARDNALYDLLNAKYLIAKKDAAVGEKFARAFDGAPLVNVYENRQAMPRAFMVYRAQAVADGEAAFAAVTARSFDPRQTVVVEDAPTTAPPGAAIVPPRITPRLRATNTVEYTVDSDAPGYLFVADVYYSGWRATIDGQETSLLRANYLFRAVYVAAGAHTVRMEFDPWSFKLGAGATAAALLALAGVWWRQRAAATK